MPDISEYEGLTAQQIISKYKRGSINREFPSEYELEKWEETERDAKKGIDAAQKAHKLLTDSRFDK